ncbi:MULTISPECIES: TRAP transporter small permease subunit [unclassified Marinobacterium]|jgi:TRAP-type C4-dicarboxylate transport system permease small subunit|uniref:TRAP transporter small permease subunit n=1 Tax=unclassified Marinobacterium TaxID=2644139 RepID=UPI001569E286|nr:MULTISPECIES: TRAP transporter small permease [unclassified Marinobacterium]NRP36462.1 Tripartite ATP-independent periplasmic transporter, DctQ component [Marinobacterium sp. xm-d-579]NRP48227.1 Tripartite ATP-independent periplasmic transporter, DctQ component [Marinobacterium sp. xm-d-543]NRP95704.1 Tripartite ATP-independent periplasmic transporter, DctQ component [Marinobacterium sp. xm-g-59]NRQ02727.1 Tripartite ATP-independent periplasmic transporter, DctQ component [Marinobacterium sp
MSGSASVLTDNSLLSRIDQRLYKLETGLALLGGFTVLGLIILAVVSVAGRNLFSQPIPGYIDWIEQFMPLIAFMGIAYTQRDGGHIRMDMLVNQLKGRVLWFVEALTTLIILLLVILLIWGSWSHFERSFDFSAPLWSRDSTIDIGLPLWPAKLLAPIALSVLSIRLVLQIWGFARAFVLNQTSPVAVPLTEDIETQARKEADQLEEMGGQ